MTEIENKILSIVDDDIRAIFIAVTPNGFAPRLPIEMQLIKSLKELITLISDKKSEHNNNCTDDGCRC